jgi:3-hydroxy-3-methylglutaryl CoA synthase
MCFCSDREDVVSMAKTAMLQLLERYGIDPASIGK